MATAWSIDDDDDDDDVADNDDTTPRAVDDEDAFGVMNPWADETNNRAHNTAKREKEDFIIVVQ